MRFWGRIGFSVATFIFSYSLFATAKTSAALPEPAEHLTLTVISPNFLQQPCGLDQIPLPTLFISSGNLEDNGLGFAHPRKYK